MRKIKFRGWSKLDEEMFMVMGYDLVEDEVWSYHNSYSFKEIELMQYTGLKDKNGVEIYEGDIVEIVQPKQSNMWMGSSLLSSHSWENKYRNVVQWQNDNNPRWDGLLVWGGGTIEVLGNIYEHPELIRGERK